MFGSLKQRTQTKKVSNSNEQNSAESDGFIMSSIHNTTNHSNDSLFSDHRTSDDAYLLADRASPNANKYYSATSPLLSKASPAIAVFALIGLTVTAFTLLAANRATVASNSDGSAAVQQQSAPKLPQLIGYWGQEAISNEDAMKSQSSLITYCSSSNWDAIILTGLHEFDEYNYTLSFGASANYISTEPSKSWGIGQLTSHIKSCQNMGIKILLSVGKVSDDAEYKFTDGFGETLGQFWYEAFLGGYSPRVARPFGPSTALDGLDIGFDVTASGERVMADALKYVRSQKSDAIISISRIPNCQFLSDFGVSLDEGNFDIIQLPYFTAQCSDGSQSFNFDAWAKQFPQKSLYITLPGSPGSASSVTGDFVDSSAIPDLLKAVRSSKNAKQFAGFSLWDVSSSSTYIEAGHTFASDVSTLLGRKTASQ